MKNSNAVFLLLRGGVTFHVWGRVNGIMQYSLNILKGLAKRDCTFGIAGKLFQQILIQKDKRLPRAIKSSFQKDLNFTENRGNILLV